MRAACVDVVGATSPAKPVCLPVAWLSAMSAETINEPQSEEGCLHRDAVKGIFDAGDHHGHGLQIGVILGVY